MIAAAGDDQAAERRIELNRDARVVVWIAFDGKANVFGRVRLVEDVECGVEPGAAVFTDTGNGCAQCDFARLKADGVAGRLWTGGTATAPRAKYRRALETSRYGSKTF